MKRIKTDYPGVYYREADRIGKKGIEKVFYIVFKKDGKFYEEKVGRQFADDMTAARASRIRGERFEGKRQSRKEIREADKVKKWTIDNLFNKYISDRQEGKSKQVDNGRYDKYLKDSLGNKEPKNLVPLDADRIRKKLLKELSPQTVKHVLNLLTWIINYGVNKGHCIGLSFRIEKPTVDNIKTETLTDAELKRLLQVLDKSENIQVANLVRIALFTGMRRGELLNLQWPDLDFDRGFIAIRNPKGGKDQVIPMNDSAKSVFENHERTKSQFVFPGKGGEKRTTVQKAIEKIKMEAELPEDFRPLHGLRHVFASMLASSGQVDMYTLQKLLTHKSPLMTQRYAHLRDETLKNASELAGDILSKIGLKKEGDNVKKINEK